MKKHKPNYFYDLPIELQIYILEMNPKLRSQDISLNV